MAYERFLILELQGPRLKNPYCYLKNFMFVQGSDKRCIGNDANPEQRNNNNALNIKWVFGTINITLTSPKNRYRVALFCSPKAISRHILC